MTLLWNLLCLSSSSDGEVGSILLILDIVMVGRVYGI